jgi:hypothetical protein
MNLILNFLWVLGVEYLQNLPFILGVVFAWTGFKRGLVWWKWVPMLLAGSFGCAVFTSSLDWIKLLATTLTARAQDVTNIIRLGTIFSVAAGLLMIYFMLTAKLRKPFWADVVFGVIVSVLVAVAETLGNIAPFLILMHALGFAAAAPSLVTLFRRSADVAPGREMLIRIGLITLVMSVFIVVFDYVPHLRG